MVVGQKHQPEVWDVTETTKQPKKQNFRSLQILSLLIHLFMVLYSSVYEVGKSIGFAIAIRTAPCSNAGRCCCGRDPYHIKPFNNCMRLRL